MTTPCPVVHIDLGSRYCPQCGTKVDQPILDLRAHLQSQWKKSVDQKRGKATIKWGSWIEALDALMNPSTTTSTLP